MALNNPGITVIYNRMRREIQHDKCIVMFYLEPDGGYAYAVANGSDGRLIAWDGVYNEFDNPPNLADLDWDDWDDMASKLLIATQTHWVNKRVGHLLMPSFTPARAAAELVYTHADSTTSAQMAGELWRARIVAYLPIADDDIYDRELAAIAQRIEQRSRDSDTSAS